MHRHAATLVLGPYPLAVVGPDLQVAGGNDMAMQRIDKPLALGCDKRPSPTPKLTTGSVKLPKIVAVLGIQKDSLAQAGAAQLLHGGGKLIFFCAQTSAPLWRKQNRI